MDGLFLNVLQMNAPTTAATTSSALATDPLRPLTPTPNKPQSHIQNGHGPRALQGTMIGQML